MAEPTGLADEQLRALGRLRRVGALDRFYLGGGVARSLTYFADAEKDPALPAGMTKAGRQDIKAFFRREAPTMLAP
ncbi:MAG: hypothetical protein HY744_27495 [Deltaproteobacteria bacterium]|nr:hypothetical protein [Deltaproteobacteria bacterium]